MACDDRAHIARGRSDLLKRPRRLACGLAIGAKMNYVHEPTPLASYSLSGTTELDMAASHVVPATTHQLVQDLPARSIKKVQPWRKTF
jgi:hypothetical protein